MVERETEFCLANWSEHWQASGAVTWVKGATDIGVNVPGHEFGRMKVLLGLLSGACFRVFDGPRVRS